jgi:hypothetical protein
MSDLKTAATLALEALKSMKETLAEHDEPTTFNEDEAIKALEEALAKQEQGEPVAWQWLTTAHFRKKLPKDAEKGAWNPLYTTPQPAQKPWVGLTDEDEIDWEEGGNLKDLVKAIEKKLKEKNT